MKSEKSQPARDDGALILLPSYRPVPCEAHPGWPYLRFTREGRFLAVLEQLIMEGGQRALDDGSNHGLVTRVGWQRLNLSAYAEWLVYEHCDGGLLEIWKYPEAERLHRVYFERGVTRVEFRPDGAQLACLVERDAPGVWCWDGEFRPRKLGEGTRVYSFLTYSADSRYLAAASDDRRIHLWNAQTLESVAVSPPQDSIAGLSLSGDGTWLAAGSDKEVRIWETAGGLLRALTVGVPVWRTFFSPLGDVLAVVHEKGVQIWDARKGERLSEFAFLIQHSGFQLSFSCDGRMAAWGNGSRAGGGPWFDPPLGFYSVDRGGVITTLRQAPIVAPWAFTGHSNRAFR